VKDEPRGQTTALSIKTLLIAGATSAITALVVPMFWEPGTVFAAAMTPIIAAVVTELVRRPVDTVQAVTVKKKVAGGAVVFEPPLPPQEEDFDPLAPASTEELEALPPTTSSRAVHKRRGLTRRQWKIALVTGLLAFACVAVLLTVSELVAGDPVTSDRGATTLFGGSQRERDDAKPADDEKRDRREERDAAEEEATPTPTPTPTATSTPTPAPTATVTPAPDATAVPAVPEPQTAPPSASPTPTP
jgi:hypothetical protein